MMAPREKSDSSASDSGVGSTERKEVDAEVNEEVNEEEDEDEDGMWVEKVAKRDGDNAFVGPVPEIKVQATVTKKE